MWARSAMTIELRWEIPSPPLRGIRFERRMDAAPSAFIIAAVMIEERIARNRYKMESVLDEDRVAMATLGRFH